MTARRSRAALLLVALALIGSGCGAEEATERSLEGTSPEPFLRRRDHEVEYAGPGRERADPATPKAITIAWFAPADENHPTAGGLWQAARLALDEANAAGGYEGTPFELAPVWSAQPWGTGIADLARRVYADDVVAITGAPDGPAAHLVEQVVAKARLPFVSPVSTDPSTHLVNVPWIFSLAPGDHLWAPVLAKDIDERLRNSGVHSGLVVVASTHHDARVAETAMLEALETHRIAPVRRITFRPGQHELEVQVAAVRESEAAAVLVLGDALDSARVVKALRETRVGRSLFGGPAMGRRTFRDAAGADGEGVRFPLLWHPGLGARDFERRFRERCRLEPDYAEAFAYDAVTLLVEAVRRAGLNRARIRDALKACSAWEGAGGRVTWDKTGQNTRPPVVGTLRGGAIVPAHPRYDPRR